jgi:hypothetical protein
MKSPLPTMCLIFVFVLLMQTGLTTAFAQEQIAPTSQSTQLSSKAVPAMRLTWSSPGVENVFWHGLAILRCIYWMTITSHILFALLVLHDIRKQRQGNHLFVVLVLLGGVFAAGVYAIFRIGNKNA